MKFTDIFVRRPVLAIVVTLVILISGLQAINGLTVRQYPKLERATITVTTSYIGADADLVRGFISTPLERVIASADGIDYMESSSVQGLSTIRVILRLNYDANKALAEIASKVDQVRGDLPPEAEVPIINSEAAGSEIASMYLSFGSDILAENQVNDYLLRVVQPRLSALPGVQRADILGGQTFAIRAWLSPARMAALNITATEVRQALAANNYLSALGQTKGALTQLNLTANTDLSTVEDFRRLVVREREGVVIRLEDIADVQLGADNYESAIRFSGEKAVFMGIWVMPNANSLDVIRSARGVIEELRATLPTGLSAAIAYDSTTYIESAISEVRITLIETVLIVGIVIFLFLGSVRTALVPLLAIPVSLIGAVFLMQAFGFTLNLLTLLAIVLSVGLVVDDAIVVVENIERHLHEGLTPFEAALKGARELVGPVIAMTITLAAVYAPIGFQGGITGALFREFAFTLAGAVTISGLVALTLSPMMGSKLLRKGDDTKGLAGLINRSFERVKIRYGRMVDYTLTVRPAIYVIWAVITLMSVPMYMNSYPELAPNEDQGVVFGAISGPPNSTLDQTSFYADQAGEIFKAVPEGEQTFQITNPGRGFGGLLTVPWEERERDIFAIHRQLFGQTMSLTGVDHPMFLPPALPSAGLFPVEVVLVGAVPHSQLVDYARQIVGPAMASGQFGFLDVDTKIDQAKAEVILDRDKVASLGLNLQQVGADLGAMFGGNFVNRFSLEGRSYKVIPQVQRSDRLNAEQLDQLYVSGPAGELVPFGTFARVDFGLEPRTLNRFNQLNSVKLEGVYAQSLGQAITAIETNAAKVLPPGVAIDYAGQSRQFKQEQGKFLPSLILACVLIFLVLAAQFNSFRDPFIILLGSVPLAMFGALIFTVLKAAGPPGWSFPLTEGWTTTMNIYSQVGLVTLVGLVAKNGILLVEFANVLQEQGKSKLEAIRESARTRLRPILMTSVATVVGHFPLTLVSGAGAEARNSIGLVLVGGMAIGTVFTLFVLPSIYMLIAKEHNAPGAASAAASAAAPVAAPAHA
jgi:multidrug efflux pump